MKRYYGGEEPDDEQFFDNFEDEEFEGEEEENVAYIDSDGLVEIMHMDLAQTELNQHILGKAIDLAKQSFFWRFKSTASKLNEIKNIYRHLVRMTDDEGNED